MSSLPCSPSLLEFDFEPTPLPPFDPCIPSIPYNTLSYEQFAANFMALNRPVLLTDVPCPLVLPGASEACSSGSLPTYLLTQYKNTLVPVTTTQMPLNTWHSLGESRPYLKDWHVNQGTQPLFTRPHLFREDWLNGAQKNYEFMYWGAAGSGTQRHSDVLQSFSWSVSLQGVKHWTFFVDDQEISCIQHPMSAVFVPSGLEHKVQNISECISVNCNWVNRFNVQMVLDFLKAERLGLIRELEGFGVSLEIQGKSDNIEAMMRAACGLKLKEFYDLVAKYGGETVQGKQVLQEIRREFPHLF